MKRPNFSLTGVLTAFCLFLFCVACQQKNETASAPPSPFQKEESSESVDMETLSQQAPAGQNKVAAVNPSSVFSSWAGVPGPVDSLKKFIRKATLRFRVKNTVEATIRIEDIAMRHGGYILSSQLNNRIERRQNTPASRDTVLETTRFVAESTLVLKVPYTQLDTTLRAIGKWAVLLDYRSVQAEDVTLGLLEQALIRAREVHYQAELAQAKNQAAEHPKPERMRDSRAAADESRLATAGLEDEIRWSTIQVQLYQSPQIQRLRLANTEVDQAGIPFGIRLRDAFSGGLEIFTLIFLGLLHLWAPIVLFLSIFYAWKRWARKSAIQTQKS